MLLTSSMILQSSGQQLFGVHGVLETLLLCMRLRSSGRMSRVEEEEILRAGWTIDVDSRGTHVEKLKEQDLRLLAEMDVIECLFEASRFELDCV